MTIPTLHIQVGSKELMADTVILTGDPLRAKWISEKYIDDATKINDIRGMLGYTGYYNNKKITIMSSGMGMPSIAIYSYELYKFYDVEKIIRIGTCGAFGSNVMVDDILIPKEVYTTSNFASTTFDMTEDTLKTSEDLYNVLNSAAIGHKVKLNNEKIASIDAFYKKNDDKVTDILLKKGCVAGDMETFALYANAKFLNKKAACLLTVPVNIVTNQIATDEQNKRSIEKAVEIILSTL